jgi:PAS domain S-box-containing protein
VKRTALAYGQAIAAVAVVVGCRLALRGVLGNAAPLLPFIPVVFLAAWYGGLGPGLLATALSAAAAAFFFLPSHNGFRIDEADDVVRTAVFVGVGALLTWFCASLRHNITERRRTEDAVDSARRQLELVTSCMAVPVTRCSRDFKYVWVSKAYADWLGRSPDEISGRPIADNIGREAFEQLRPQFERVLAGETVRYEDQVHFPGIGARWISAAYTPTRGARGEIDGWVAVIIDIDDRIKAQQHNEETARKTQEIFKLVHSIGLIGHWEWNAQTDENCWSPEIEALYGLPPGGFERGYDGWAKLLHPDDLDKAAADVQRALETGKYFTEFRVVWPDGSVHWLEARAKVFHDEQGKPLRIVGVNMDVTERKRFEEALKDTDRRKDQFLATLAHKLRNPLAPLRNGLELMKLAGGDEAMVGRTREMMERQLGHMVRLVDDLLDLSRVSRGRIELRRERIELTKIVRQAVETSRPLIEQAGQDFTFTLAPQPIVVDADVTRLAQVFSNLLNNAAKYTPRDGRINLAVERQGSDAIVSVRDSGAGIPPELLPKVFEMFAQVDRSLQRANSGLGIGLSLVKALVEMHGGSVEARSDGPGEGSEFVVRLPVLLAPTDAHGPQPNAASTTVTPRRRILVVDDNRDTAISLATVLNILGHRTQVAFDGLEALEAARDFQPDVVLLDIGMPKLNGHDTARRLRQEPWGREIVLVAVTGWGQDDDRQRSQESGFSFHLVKPVDPAALEQILAEMPLTVA